MDAVVILIITLVVILRAQPASRVVTPVAEVSVTTPHKETEMEVPVVEEERVAKTNDTYYKDELAFTSISRALGFPKESV